MSYIIRNKLLFALLCVASVPVPAQYEPVYRQLTEQFNYVQNNTQYQFPHFIVEDESGLYEGLVDSKGETIVPIGRYSNISYHKEDGVFTVKLRGKMGVIDTTGREIVPVKYSNIVYIACNSGYRYCGYYSVYIGNHEGYINKDGVEILAPIYDKIYNIDTHILTIERDGKKGIADVNGKYAILWDDFIYGKGDELVPFKEGGLWGYFNVNSGKVQIPPQYTTAYPFTNGLASVQKDNKTLEISMTGSVVRQLSVLNNTTSDIDINIPHTSRVQDNTFAVVIANEDYTDFVVPYVRRDGFVFKEYCEKALGIPTENIMYYEDATLNNIHSVISRIRDLADAFDGEASIIFYFAGQGMSDNQKRPYLLPSDCSVKMIQFTAYPVGRLFSELSALNVQCALLFLDCSFTGNNRDGKTIFKDADMSLKSSIPPLEGNAIAILAASTGETSFADEEKSHGIFTYYLCKAMQNRKGNLNIQDLYRFLSEQIPKASSHIMGTKQNPLLLSNIKSIKSIKL